MDDDDSSVSVMIDFEQKAKFVRFIGGGMLPTKIKMKAEVMPTEDTVDNDFDVAFSKIKFWFDSIVTNSIIFCKNNEVARSMLIKDGLPTMPNHLIMTPFEPTDEHLAILFQAKMTALSDQNFDFGSIKIKSDTSNGLTFTYVGSWDEDLPEMKDWFDITPYYFDVPWWQRSDISSIDMIVGEFDSTKIPTWASKLDFIEESFRVDEDDSKQVPHIESAVIIKGIFKPKIIKDEIDPQIDD
jgi:hypothetical protein